MDIYKLKFTRLQNEILRFLYIKSGESFNLRRIAISLDVSLTAVAKALNLLKKEGLVIVEKDKESKRLSISLNKENPKVFYLKRIENLRLIYDSGLVEFLADKFPMSTIILFGSYSSGEDIANSDIDIAIIGSKAKDMELSKFEKILKKEISLNYYDNINNINKNLKSNILNGITIAGAIQL